MRIFHNTRKSDYRSPFGAVTTGSGVRLAIDVADLDVEKVTLEAWRDGEAHAFAEMKGFQDGRFRASIRAPKEGCLIWYRFIINYRDHSDDPNGGEIRTVFYANNSRCTGGEGRVTDDSEAAPFQITVYKPFEVPEWYKDGIVYQIFPDRFARDDGWRERCESANERVNSRRSDIRRTIEEDWDRPAYYVRDDSGKVTEWPVYGGSLKGIEEKLDYLKSLGVNAIYLNPIFEASSNHRYDTGDYMKIDPALGTEEDFTSLAEAARSRDIRLILDGVFNHTGSDSRYFDRYGNYYTSGNHNYPDGKPAESGAWGDPESPYRSWYKFDENEQYGYKSWWGVEDLPEVNEDDPGFREFILGEDGVAAHWLRMGASGWRLDVADELPDSFIKDIRSRIKETDGGSLLLGEVWEDASNKISYDERRRYLLGDELDATMNYPLRDILLDYINYTISSGTAADKLMCLAENYPKENYYAALNLIGSHDRMRILTAMAAEEDYDSAVRKVKLLSTLQYSLPGVPCVYYGDEAGLAGGTDPENRSGFPWGSEDQGLEYHYRMLGLIYDEHPALKSGGFTPLSGSQGLSDDVFAFVRDGADAGGTEETILVLANRSYGGTDVDLNDIRVPGTNSRVGDIPLRGAYALELLTSKELKTDDEGRLGVVHMDRLSVMMISIRRKRPDFEDLGRTSGVVCHISSLPKPVLGTPAKAFVDFLAEAGFGVWQVLPLNPAGSGGSPYSSYAAFAGNPDFINRDELPDNEGYVGFLKENNYWLRDYITFIIAKEASGGRAWTEWSDEYRNAEPDELLESLTEEQQKRANELCHEQYWFSEQWKDLRSYANAKGIRIMGDLPMFMALDSADVWANRKIFRMDSGGRQSVHAGVPPDAFSGEGQDWGNPLYDWDSLEATGYDWWTKRISQCAERFDILRIDHFRGFSEYFAIPEGGSPSNGRWQHGPGLRLMAAIRKKLSEKGLGMKLFAEDLGYLDAGVKNLLKLSGLPGMDIWQFNADDMKEMCEKEPERAAERAFYTGTHDNNTLAGWLGELGRSDSEASDIITEIYESPAMLAMLQIQDVFALGGEARMNVPGVPEGNWTWKIPGSTIKEAFADAEHRAAWFRSLAERSGRIYE